MNHIRYAAAACQTDLPNPANRRGMRVNTDRIIEISGPRYDTEDTHGTGCALSAAICAGGPVAVVYPEAVWYTYVDEHDIDDIVESHLKNGRVVERLLTPPHLGR